MSHKRVARQQLPMPCYTSTGMTGICATSPTPATLPLDALQRISSLRQSLSSVVASQAPSLDRSDTLSLHLLQNSGVSKESTVMFLLTSSQRRMKELLNENHRLELLCIKQEDTIKEIRAEMSINKRHQHATVADDVVAEKPATSCVRSTPFGARRMGLRDRTDRGSKNEELESPGSFIGAFRSSSIAAELDDVVQQLVSTAIALFPELEVRMESACHNGADEWSTARDILYFIESHLEEWSGCASRENVSFRETSMLLSRVLTCIDTDQREWCECLFDIAYRLQAAWRGQKHAMERRDALICKLEDDVKSLATELSDAVEVRMQCECRCAELEETLSRMMDKRAVHDGSVQSLQEERRIVRDEANSPLALADQEGITVIEACGVKRDVPGMSDGTMPKMSEDSLRRAVVEHDAEALRLSLDRITKERDELRAQLRVVNDALDEAELRVKVVGTEREMLQSEVGELKYCGGMLTVGSTAAPQPSLSSTSEAMRPWCGPLLSRGCDHDLAEGGDAASNVSITGLLHVISDTTVDIFSVAHEHSSLRSPGLLFHVGCAIALDSGAFNNMPKPDLSLTAWKRLLLHFQNGFVDVPFHNADRAADSLQFFYSLLFHSGMVEHMADVEIIASITSALCAMYVYVTPSSEGCRSLDVYSNSCAGGSSDSCEPLLLERSCSYETICRLMERSRFDFAALWEAEDRALLFQTMKALLLPQVSLYQLESLMYTSGIEAVSNISSRLHDPPVRHQLIRLLVALAHHAFTMRSASVNKYWANERFSLYQHQMRFRNEFGEESIEVPYNMRAVAEAQLLLISTTVLPLCEAVVGVFPRLQPCLVALRGNLHMWTLCGSNGGSTSPSSIASVLEQVTTPSTSEEKLPPGAANFKLVSSEEIKRGSLVVDTGGFISMQEEISALYKENAVLRDMLQKLFHEMDSARQHVRVVGDE
ncbi:uncharacterized protein TEOVI_000841500 [Trypanosoma equiperdum]|uniref:PDEase domain-containing protein n=1 Tax=Trypanosoma equiperdum TaxID=5694 RepID=A0A1G4I545_TRYEQ|nr:hypothetical protein, conserved [Trypanosoma equiperdum]